MLSENLNILRKQKGLSQDALAAQLHVVRQTVSKWEKGISVPDADMLIRLAEILEVPVSKLLGGGLENEENRDHIAEHLAQIAQQLAVKNKRARRVWKVVVGIVLAIIGFNLLLIVFSFAAHSTYTDDAAIKSGIEIIEPNESVQP